MVTKIKTFEEILEDKIKIYENTDQAYTFAGKEYAKLEETKETENPVIKPNDSIYQTGFDGPGLTKREYFSAQAMGSVAGSLMNSTDSCWKEEDVARISVKLAIALIAELNK